MKRRLNDGWEFAKMPLGSCREDLENAAFTAVDLPHDWLIWQAEDLYESADAWYRRRLSAEELSGPAVFLRFDGVYMDSEVLLNGEVLCSHPYGYTAFTVPLTGKARPGENEVLVHIRHQSPNSRWYSGSGIFRDVHLISLPEDHLVPDGLYLAERETETGWALTISAEAVCVSEEKDSPRFLCRVKTPEGRTLAESSGRMVKAADAAAILGEQAPRFQADWVGLAELNLSEITPWSPEHPALYTLEAVYGEQTESRRIGFRTLAFDPERGFLLNHEPVKFRGVCLHHDLGALGAAFHEKAARRQLRLMKEMGVNALRTSHNPPAEKLLNLCDEMGILVDDEAFDMWERPKTEYDYARFFPAWEERDVAAWVRRDRPHPSVVMWSIGNEIYDMHADQRGTEVTRMLMEQVRAHDPARHGAVTFGCNYMPWEGGQRCADVVKIAGYNYGEKLYDEHHRQHPDWVIYGSETASVLSSRGIYHFPLDRSIMSDADWQCSALGNSNTSWGATDLKRMIIDDLKTPFSMGQFLWSGIDYIGEPTPYHTRSCYFGQADTACFPKDAYYLFQSYWTEKKMIHIGVSWDWNPGQTIDIPVLSNCPEVELLLNGVSLGRRAPDRMNPESCVPVWSIPYAPGELVARGYDREGTLICEDRRATPGDTARLELQAEDAFVLADGWDMTFVTVSALDGQGNPVDNARDQVAVRVEGGGVLMGCDNGDSTDPEGYKAASRRLFSGKLLIMVGSNGLQEDIRVSVCSATGAEATLEIPVQAAEPLPGQSRGQRIPPCAAPEKRNARKLEITPLSGTVLTKEHPEAVFAWRLKPEGADPVRVTWQATNRSGIISPALTVTPEAGRVTVRAEGDGEFFLRALWGNAPDHAEGISQIELSAQGLGQMALNPYEYLSAGLYDLHAGEIGCGNEKGVAFARDGESMVGFSRVDFGPAGSDRITADIFALNGDAYEIELFLGDPAAGGRRIDTLRYQKPSIWNVYQPETWTLPEKLTGIQCLCFRMRDKVHLRGFRFERQSRAWGRHPAGEADEIYGDSFVREDAAVRKIGNNVSLVWKEMDFGEAGKARLTLEGATPLEVNAVTVRMTGEDGETLTEIANFRGPGGESQTFELPLTRGVSTLSFVFLPGSSFDFSAFRLEKTE